MARAKEENKINMQAGVEDCLSQPPALICLSATLHVPPFAVMSTERVLAVGYSLPTCKRWHVDSMVVHVTLYITHQTCATSQTFFLGQFATKLT